MSIKPLFSPNAPKVASKLSLGSLIALVIGSIIGGGIFDLPQNMAIYAGGAAILIGWLITGLGMFLLCLVYQTLAIRKPELNNGVYAYASASGGDFVGFNSAWGYWVAACLGNISYLIALFGALGYFFPSFGDGSTPIAIISASCMLWLIHAFILMGIKKAAWLNTIITLAKVVPLILFIVVTLIAFDQKIFYSNFWGHFTSHSVVEQVKSTMLLTVWVFIGIESASVYSARAKHRRDVGKATLFGFVMTLLLLMSISLLSLGVLPQAELAHLKTPSMAGVLERIMGRSGTVIIVLGLLLSVGGAFLAWSLLAVEALFTPAREGLMPKFLIAENDSGIPTNALWLTSSIIQLFLIITLFSKATYLKLILLSTSMILIPYFFSAVYAIQVALQRENYLQDMVLQRRDCIIGIGAAVYCCWLLYAAGLKYLLLSALLYMPGIILYVLAQHQQRKSPFQFFEYFILCILIGLAGCTIYLLGVGELTL